MVNDGVNLIDVLGMAYKSLNEAGFAASKAAHDMTKKWMEDPQNKEWVDKTKAMEYWGYLCKCACDLFNYTPPQEGVHPRHLRGNVGGMTKAVSRSMRDKACKKAFGSKWTVAGWYHSHPFSHSFSQSAEDRGGSDARVSNRNNLPAFVGYPDWKGKTRVDRGDPHANEDDRKNKRGVFPKVKRVKVRTKVIDHECP